MRAHHPTHIGTATLVAALAVASAAPAVAQPPPRTAVFHSNQEGIWGHSNQDDGVASLITPGLTVDFWNAYLEASRPNVGMPRRPDIRADLIGPDRHGNNPSLFFRGGGPGVTAITGGPVGRPIPAPGALGLLGVAAALGGRRRRTGRVSAPRSQH